jgi:hypothetical protein
VYREISDVIAFPSISNRTVSSGGFATKLTLAE